MRANRFVIISLAVLLISVGLGAGGQQPPAPRHEVKQIIAYDQMNKIAILMGRQEGNQVEFFALPVYESEQGKLFSLRMVPQRIGRDTLEIAGSGRGDDSRLLALVNTKRVVVFKLAPLPTDGKVSYNELSTPERILEDHRGIERLRATETRVVVQQGQRDIAILDAKTFQEIHRLSLPDPISNLAVDQDRLGVYAAPWLRFFDLQGNPVGRPVSVKLVLLGAWEPGFFAQTDERTLTLWDRNGNRSAEIKTEQPIQAVAVAQERVGVLSGSQALLFDLRGRRVAAIGGGPFERLAAASRRFFLSKGQEIRVVDAQDGKSLQTISLRNRLEQMIGFGGRLFIVVREVAEMQRLIYALYDENGTRIEAGFLPTFEGDRP